MAMQPKASEIEEEARNKLAAMIPVRDLRKAAEEGYGEAQKNAQRSMEKALYILSLAKAPDFQKFLKASETREIILAGKNAFKDAEVVYAHGKEDIYSVKVTFEGRPRILSLSVGQDSMQLALTELNGTPREYVIQKAKGIEFSKLA